MNTSRKFIDERRERVNREARALIETERKDRDEKTERLRSLRLAQELKKPTVRGKPDGKAEA